MPLKALLNGQPIFARDAIGISDYTCHECGEGMHYRRAFKRTDGVRVQAHFAHDPTPSGQTPRTCSTVGQSEEHLNAKECIRTTAPSHFVWLRGIKGDVEVPLGDRRADVLFTLPDGTRIIFEPQFTKISRQQIAERTKDYHEMGCHVVWCFPERREDLHIFCKAHFYCIGLLSDDGNEIMFWGTLDSVGDGPILRKPFDDIPSQQDTVNTVYGYLDHGRSYLPPLATDTVEDEAFRAWSSGGSMLLGLWLAKYKERITGRRNFTVEEYGAWVKIVRRMGKSNDR